MLALKDNIKVGDYVRTEYGISKVEKDRRIHYGLLHPVIDILKQEVIIKSSQSIIDLIEVGDYVNGCLVDNINYDLNKEEDVAESIRIILPLQNDKDILKNEDIKSIITKEKFKAMEYKVER